MNTQKKKILFNAYIMNKYPRDFDENIYINN